MVLTNSGSLFQNTGLLQDDGRINQRWAQDGSTVVNVTDLSVTAATALVSSSDINEACYITDIYVQVAALGGDAYDILYFSDGVPLEANYRLVVDATTGVTAGQIFHYHFNTPLKFTSNVTAHMHASASMDVTITITGWIE